MSKTQVSTDMNDGTSDERQVGQGGKAGTLRRAGLMLVLAVAAAGGYLGLRDPGGTAAVASAAPPAAVPVSVSAVEERAVIEWDQYSGRIEAIESVEVRSRVGGYIESVNFEPGSLVKAGDTLFVVDARPFEAEVARAEAALASARARLALTSSELTRAEHLRADRAIAQREFDERQNARREAQAALRGAQAALEIAKLELGYTRITAPISGRVSRAEVTAGNLVAGGAAGPKLTSIVSTAPVYASFEVDERSFLKYAANGATPPGRIGETVQVHLGLASEEGHPHVGTLEFVDNAIDSRSGTIRLRAVFRNEDEMLMPGMYARLKLGGVKPAPALLVDDRAVGTDQDKRYVLVVGDDNKVSWREVKLGPMVDGLRVVREGLAAGERIVVNGLQRVRPGATVAPESVAMDSRMRVARAQAPVTERVSLLSEAQ
jgi:multidrug efflux system membrane fusion protein